MPEASRCPFIRFGRAVGLVRAIEGAVEVRLLGPLHIIGDNEIKFAVAIVIDPRGAGGKFAWAPESRGLRHIGKSAVAVVVEQMVLADSGNNNVVKTVVVVVADGDAEANDRNAETA